LHVKPVRQHGVVKRLAGRINATADLEAAILLGSLARGDADDLSDVDAFVIVREGRFDAAWSERHTLRGDEALASWDDVDPERHEIAAHKWITRDLVLVEVVLATASSGIRLADPFAVVAGDAAVAERIERRPPIERADLRAFADKRVATGRAHEIERAYESLVNAVRRVGSGQTTQAPRE
jgi:predicted nucleotidyltransferase